MQTKEGTGRGGGGVALYFVSGAVFGRAIIMQDALQGNDTEPLLAPIMLPVRLSQQQISTAVGERQTKCDDQPELLEVEPEALVPVERLVQVCQQAGRWSELIPFGCQKVSENVDARGGGREVVGEKQEEGRQTAAAMLSWLPGHDEQAAKHLLATAQD